MSWDDVVRSMVLESIVWWPHSLHTAEATGSGPVAPTSSRVAETYGFGQLACASTGLCGADDDAGLALDHGRGLSHDPGLLGPVPG